MERQPPQTEAMEEEPLDSVMVDCGEWWGDDENSELFEPLFVAHKACWREQLVDSVMVG